MTEPDPNRTPPTVIGAVAAGTVVVPFLIVYSFLFIAHGAFVEVDQPDITGSRSGELVAGLIALGYLAFVLWGMGRLLNGWDRWVFAAGQLVTFGVALDFLLDSASGEPQVPAVVLVSSLLALALTCLPPSWQWVRSRGGEIAAPALASGAAPAVATAGGAPAVAGAPAGLAPAVDAPAGPAPAVEAGPGGWDGAVDGPASGAAGPGGQG